METLSKVFEDKYNKNVKDCTNEEIYHGLLSWTKEQLKGRGYQEGKKKIYYISAEFLIGKLLSNNLINLGVYDEVAKYLKENGKELSMIEEIEPEPSLGNGGLGRLAACFLDSIATLGLPGEGIGLNYHLGLFKQEFKDHLQFETPNPWIQPESWLTDAGVSYYVPFKGFMLKSTLYDIDVAGYENKAIKLRLFDIDIADESIVGEGISFDKRDLLHNLTLFLYPDDSDDAGRKLRIYQQYFMVSNAAQLILDEATAKGCNLHDLADYAVIQINDTHPSMVIPELIRLLTERGIEFEEACEIVSHVCAYTNHTIMAEALEKWPIEIFQRLLPRVYQIVEEINRRFVLQIQEQYPGNNEKIAKDDWNLVAKRYLENETVVRVLNEIDTKKYVDLISKKEKFHIQDIIKILNEDEQFCKNVCQKYIDTMSKEMLLEIDNKILHIFIEDEYINLKEEGKINNQNYKEYLDEDFDVYEYDSYQELYNSVIKAEIAYDLNDLALFDENGNWDFYITFEELKKVGYGFMVKDQFPLIENYAVPEDKIFEFFDYFSLEQLEDFEQSLNQYFNEGSIVFNEDSYDGLESKENANFNRDILRLACGLTTYEDFIEDYTEHSISYYDLSLSKVIEYFKENEIKDLMEYGSDGDEGLYHLSSMYQEIMDKLGIKYSNVYTEDVSDGKYLTTIIFENDSSIQVDTSAWNGIKTVAENMESIYESYENLKEKIKPNEVKNEKEFEYDFN